MKTTKFLMTALFLGTFLFTGCFKKFVDEDKGILPSNFKVDIPDALSYSDGVFKANKNNSSTELDGNQIYGHLGTFIWVGEGAADIVVHIIAAIAIYHIDQPMTLSYQSNEDGRIKNLEVVENVQFEGVSYEFKLTITDALSETNADGGNALQVFWNRSPVQGVAILKPYNIDRVRNNHAPDAVFRVDYSEAGEYGYDKHMIVSISGLPLESPLVNPYSIGSMKMFAGRNGNIVDVYGNSNHPNARMFTDSLGFNWAFVASGDRIQNIGVAEVGLPGSYLDETDRSVLLEDNSIKSVFEEQIYALWPTLDPSEVEVYLHNTEAPGYFNHAGFVRGGTSPGIRYNVIESRLSGLTPYNPYDITSLDVEFN